MLKVLGYTLLLIVFLCLSVGFLWVGTLGAIELLNSYEELKTKIKEVKNNG